jgi:hypothetical protein
LLAVDREIGRRGRHRGLEGQQKPPERNLKRRGGDDEKDACSKKGRSARAEAAEAPLPAAAAAAAAGAVFPCRRSPASRALRNPHLLTVTKRRHALRQQELELQEIARKLRRHGRRRQGAASPSRADGQEPTDG